jgi:hypothetical protein
MPPEMMKLCVKVFVAVVEVLMAKSSALWSPFFGVRLIK